MMNARPVTEPMNIQWRQRKLRYWRKSNVRSGGSVSTLVGTLNPAFIDSDPRYPLRQISDRAMGIAAGDDSKAPAPPSNSRKSVCSKMACRVVEGRRFGIGPNALGHLPQHVVATVDVADEVHPPNAHSRLEWALSQTASGTDPSKARIWPPLGPDAHYAHAPLVTPVQGSAFKTVLGPFFSAQVARAAFMPLGEARNGGARQVPRSPS